MFLQDFFDAQNKINIDFGDLMWIYSDKDSGPIPDDYDAWECFNDLIEDHPDEINYYGCYVTRYDELEVYIDINNIEALIEKYYPDYYQD